MEIAGRLFASRYAAFWRDKVTLHAKNACVDARLVGDSHDFLPTYICFPIEKIGHQRPFVCQRSPQVLRHVVHVQISRRIADRE